MFGSSGKLRVEPCIEVLSDGKDVAPAFDSKEYEGYVSDLGVKQRY